MNANQYILPSTPPLSARLVKEAYLQGGDAFWLGVACAWATDGDVVFGASLPVGAAKEFTLGWLTGSCNEPPHAESVRAACGALWRADMVRAKWA